MGGSRGFYATATDEEINDYENKNFYKYVEMIFVKEEILIVNHIFSISSAYEKEDFSAKTILTKVNNIKVKNMN